MIKFYRQALKLHKKCGGKMEIKSKVPLKNRRDLSLAYTPGVAKVCKEIFRDKRLAKVYTIKQNTVAVVTDGSAVLGLGNLGPEAALPVMEGKCALFKTLANIDAFPICLDTQDEEEIIRTIKNIAPVFGGINLEDISAPRCFEIECRLKAELDIPVFHDDQNGTAVVVLAALINALKIKHLAWDKAKIVINCAGAAGTAVSGFLVKAGFKHLIVCDRQGIIYQGRQKLSTHKKYLAQITNINRLKGNLPQALRNADVFIGVSVKNVLTPAMVKLMNARPVVFALANPVPEISPKTAKKAGAYIMATGQSNNINQINNVLVFPGIFRGALDNKVIKITEPMLIQAAKNLSACVKNPKVNKILPSVFDSRASRAVAAAIVK